MKRSADDPVKRRAELTQSVLTSAAIVIGGAYALYQAWIHRDTWQIVTLNQKIDSRRVDPQYVWLTVSVNIRNDGKVLARLPTAKMIIYGVSPASAEVTSAIRNKTLNFTAHGRIAEWPTICRYEHHIGFLLEPAESDVLTVDAFIPATWKTVKVFTFLGDVEDSGNGWERAMVYDIPKEVDNEANTQTRSPTGSVQPLCPRG